MNGRLTRVHVRGFKALEDCVLEPHSSMTILIGANGAGKTSLLDVLQLVADLVRPVPDPLAGELRGSLGVQTLPFDELLTNWVDGRRLEVELSFVALGRDLTWRIVLVPAGTRLSIEQEHLVELMAGGAAPQVLLERDARGARIRRDRGKGAQLVPVGPGPEQAVLSLGRDEVAYPDVHAAWRFVSGLSILRLTPVLMRCPALPTHELGLPDRYGRDLRARLHALQTSAPGSVPDFMRWMKTLVGWVQIRTPVKFGMVEPSFVEREGRNPVHLANASDGTTLHAYLACLQADPPADTSVYLIDDLGAPYLPEVTGQLGDIIEAMSGSRQVILATHSTSVVEAAGNIDRVWIVERAPGGAARIHRLSREDEALIEDVSIRGIGEAAFVAARPMTETEE